MPTRPHLEFLEEATLLRKAQAVVSRLGTLGDIAGRATGDLEDFAEEEVKQHAPRMEVAARVGEPDDQEFRAALVGNETQFVARLVALAARAKALEDQADKGDVGVADSFREVRKVVTALVRAETAPESQPGTVAGFFSSLSSLFVAAVAAPRPVPPPPDDLQRVLVHAAVELVYVKAAQRLAERITARVAERRNELQRYRRSIGNLQRALTAARGASTTPERSAIAGLPFDLVLGGPESARRLLRTADPIDWSESVLAHGGDLDEATALLLVEKTLADLVKPFQRPFPELLPTLLGGRSVEQAMDTLVRNGSPLAPLRPKEAPDGFTGHSIGVVEARDEGLAAVLAGALRRAGTLAVKTVQSPELPGEDVQARVVRFRGILPSEAMVSVVLDLYERLDPSAVGVGASRDWEGDLPALVSEARLRREIQARKLRGAPTKLLERWLPAGAQATPYPGAIPPVGGGLDPVAEAK